VFSVTSSELQSKDPSQHRDETSLLEVNTGMWFLKATLLQFKQCIMYEGKSIILNHSNVYTMVARLFWFYFSMYGSPLWKKSSVCSSKHPCVETFSDSLHTSYHIGETSSFKQILTRMGGIFVLGACITSYQVLSPCRWRKNPGGNACAEMPEHSHRQVTDNPPTMKVKVTSSAWKLFLQEGDSNPGSEILQV